jgi:DNA-directed RNA polymerase subunit M/transcription elongation factor TFIIS
MTEPGAPRLTKHKCCNCKTLMHTRHAITQKDGSKPLICHQCGYQSSIPAREIKYHYSVYDIPEKYKGKGFFVGRHKHDIEVKGGRGVNR